MANEGVNTSRVQDPEKSKAEAALPTQSPVAIRKRSSSTLNQVAKA